MTTGHKRLYEVAHLCRDEKAQPERAWCDKRKCDKRFEQNTELAPECLLVEMVKSRIDKGLTYLVVSVLTYLGQEAGPADLLTFVGMNKGKG